VSSTGTVTNDSDVIQPPTCSSGGSISPVGNIKKTALNAPCAEYDRDDNPDPPGCNWFIDPAQPAGRQAAPGEGASSAPAPSESRRANAAPQAPADSLPTTGPTLLPAAIGLLLAGAVLLAYRRRSA
jgi:LPXTG-motif cell wall-anchored protein